MCVYYMSFNIINEIVCGEPLPISSINVLMTIYHLFIRSFYFFWRENNFLSEWNRCYIIESIIDPELRAWKNIIITIYRREL